MNKDFVDFILKNTHLTKEKLQYDLKLKQDLGFYDLDFDGFILDFCDKFNVKINSSHIKTKGEVDISFEELEESIFSKILNK